MSVDPSAAGVPRNDGTALDLDRVAAVRVNAPAVARRVQTLSARRGVKKEFQAAWLLRAVQCIDLTTLSGDDTPGRVRRLCAKALQPCAPTCRPAWASAACASARSASITR